ncbi:MAG: hypothetical protein FWC71_06215 [Defluviitaleaceae bacterium]|nr:hypothetical protein [Defluviitaleaceae bacterium]
MHPVVFIFATDENTPLPAPNVMGYKPPMTFNLITAVKNRAAETLEAGRSFFLQWNNTGETMPARVQALKAQILQSETLTDLHELHLIVMANAENAPSGLLRGISELRASFEADFSLVRVVLCVSISESPLFPARVEKARAFIAAFNDLITRSPAPCPVCLLSNRNEFNAIRAAHDLQMADIIVRLPWVFSWLPFGANRNATSHAADTPLLFTAGISLSPNNDPPALPNKHLSSETIIAYLQSVPFSPAGIFRLRKLTLAQAETVLFRDTLFRAFNQFCSVSESTAEKNSLLFAQRVSAWRVAGVIDQLARAYALQYRLAHRGGVDHHGTHVDDTLPPSPLPALLLSFIRRDGMQEETITPSQGETLSQGVTSSPNVTLRIAWGFSIESLALMNYTQRESPCGLATTHL